MTIEKKIIKINRNHDNRLIKLKYSTILEIILEPIKIRNVGLNSWTTTIEWLED